MSLARFLLPVIAAAGLSACANRAPAVQRIEHLERERQDLTRQNLELKSELAACRTKCSSLEQSLRDRTPKAGVAGNEFQLPEDLKSQGINMKKNGAGQTVIDIPSDVFFPSGISVLSPGGKTTLSRVAELIRRNYPGAVLRVDGHADSDPIKRTKGKYHCNWDLSLDRAHFVVHYLVEEARFDPRSITCAGFGEFQPQDPANKAKNRRVEIVILQ